VKQVVQVKLLPTPEQARALEATLTACNAASTWISQTIHGTSARSAFNIQRTVYAESKLKFGLSAQPTVRAVKKVADAYKTLRGNLRVGNYGRVGSPRRAKVESKPVVFRPDAAQPFDDRCLSWQHQAKTVSIWTTTGRMRGLVYTGLPAHLELLAKHRRGESDLIRRGRNWFLIATIDLPDVAPADPTAGFVGVDLGIENIAVTHNPATGEHRDWSSGAVTARRLKNRVLRTRLQKKGTKSAKLLLKARSRKETRFAADVNHQISKTIVAEAKRTGCGIAVEDLTGIRQRVRLRKPQRATHSSWAFAQLGSFLIYKAAREGVLLLQVDPAYTSQQCSACGHIDRKNRLSQADFCCRDCGFSLGADRNASINISMRGQDQYVAAVNQPNAA
jgi:putative transposase